MGDKHIEWIDSLKGFGIFTVVFGHLAPWTPLETHIYSYHMFLFFFISGFLFHFSGSLKRYLGRKGKNLLIPFAVWDLLSTVPAIFFGEGVRDTVRKLLLVNGEICWNSPIWFLLVLFFTEAIYATVVKAKDNTAVRVYILLLSAVLWIAWDLFFGQKLTLLLNLVPPALFFFTLGDIFKRVISEKRIGVPIIAATGMVSLVFGAVLNARISMINGYFGNIFYCIIAGISGTLFFISLFREVKMIGNSKLLQCMGRNSMIIMVSHLWLFRLYKQLINFETWHINATALSFILAAITIAVIILIAKGVKKLTGGNHVLTAIAGGFGIR